jgi:hypothetical protein
MRAEWPTLQDSLIARINEQIPVFEKRRFKHKLFTDWVEQQGLLPEWPMTPKTGRLVTDEDTLKRMALLYPQLAPLQEVRQMLGQLHALKLAIGRDGRNRCLLSPYSTKTSSCAPSTTKYIFGAPSFLRGLIKPELGTALLLLDWVAQEFGIAAGLSHDTNMMQAYRACDKPEGDVYLAFGKLIGAVPQDATKAGHPKERDMFKTVALGVLYGMGPLGLAARLGIPVCEAEDLLAHHHRVFPHFWAWSELICDCAQIMGELRSTLPGSFSILPTHRCVQCVTGPCNQRARKCCDWLVLESRELDYRWSLRFMMR